MRIRRFLIGILAVVVVIAFAAVFSFLFGSDILRQTASAFQNNDSLDEFIWQQVEVQQVPSLAFALVEDGKVRFTAGYNLDPQREITENSVFQLASVSKPLTAWGVMHLVETGQIDLDAPVSSYLTRWSFPPSTFNTTGVTVRRLLSHTAGVSLSGYLGFPPDVPLQTLEESLVNAADTQPPTGVTLIAEPGTEWRYSGGGYTVLQLLIEEVTGEDFSTYMQQTVLDPLGMTQSRYSSDILPELIPVVDFQGTTQPAHRFTALAAAGAYSTAHDLGLWLRATVRPDAAQGVLTPETLASMMQPQPNAQTVGQGAYGLGYALNQTVHRGILLAEHHGNNDPGWRTYIAALPGQGAAIAILANSPNAATLNAQTSCAWLYYVTQDMTDSCLMDYVVSIFPMGLALSAILVGLIFVIATVVTGRREMARNAESEA